MIIGIVSDSHDNIDAIDHAVELLNKNNVHAVFHCGDIVSPFTQPHFKKLKCQKMYLVYGNNDGEKEMLHEKYSLLGSISQPPLKCELSGKKFIVFHVGMFLEELAESGKYDFILYGHTHKPEIRKVRNTLILNPGELGGWLTGKQTLMIVNTDSLEVQLLNL